MTHRYIRHTAADFATALAGGGTEFITSSDFTDLVYVGSYVSGGDYAAAEAFLSFDTTGVVTPPTTATLTLGLFIVGGDPTADIVVASCDWGSSVGSADWRTPSQLAALTEVGRVAYADLPAAGSAFDIDIDPAGIAVAGITRFVMFTENMAVPTTDPTGFEHVAFDSDSDTNPMFMLADGVPLPPPTASALPAQETRLRLVSMLGSILDDTVTDGILDLASLEYVEWTKNQTDEYAFFFPKTAYNEDTIPVWGNDTRVVEIQVWDCRPGEPIDPAVDQLLTWGPAVDMQTGGGDPAMHAIGKGVSTYLFAPPRYIDGQRPNRLDNPSFETGDTTGWTDGGAITSSVTTDGKVEGTYALRVESSTPGGDIHEHQTITVDGLELGRLITVTAWYKLETFTAPAYANRGLFVVALESGVVVAQSVVTIEGTPTTGIWERVETTLQVPPNRTWDLDIRLYAPQGSTLWDDIQAVEMDSVSTAGAEESLEHLCRLIILHVQDGAVGKSDVFITTDPDADAGPKIAKVWQWADEVPCDSAINEFVERDDGIDWAMRYNADTGERLFETFWPRRGSDYTAADVNLMYGPGGNLSDYRWQRDGTATVTVATAVGSGDGPDREDGYYSDPSFIGGLTIEKVFSAPTSTAINSLDPLAKGAVVGANDPPKIIEVDILDGAMGVAAGALDGIALLRGLVCGDHVPLTIDDGYVQEAASMWEIMQLRFSNPERVLTATLNRVV